MRLIDLFSSTLHCMNEDIEEEFESLIDAILAVAVAEAEAAVLLDQIPEDVAH